MIYLIFSLLNKYHATNTPQIYFKLKNNFIILIILDFCILTIINIIGGKMN